MTNLVCTKTKADTYLKASLNDFIINVSDDHYMDDIDSKKFG